MKYRGNLMEKKRPTNREGVLEAPAGDKVVAGGEVEMRDDALRSKAENVMLPRPGKGKVGSLPGKAMTGGRGAAKGRHGFTAKDAAAILGKRG